MQSRSEQTVADPLQALPPRSGYRRRVARIAGRTLDQLLDARQAALRIGPRLDAAAAELPRRRVAVLGIYGASGAGPMLAAVEELRRSRHDVEIALGALATASGPLVGVTLAERMEGGKLANLNRLAQPSRAGDRDWVLLLDDDVALGRRFLDRLLLLAERFELQLAQPALSHGSHTAWPVTRRRPCLLRQTRFVEMGPAVLMSRRAFAELTPFPEQGMGWGVCLHWAAVAERRRWRVGIADVVAVRHDLRPPATDYDRGDARSAARELLLTREHIGWRQAGEVVASYRTL